MADPVYDHNVEVLELLIRHAAVTAVGVPLKPILQLVEAVEWASGLDEGVMDIASAFEAG